MYKLFLSIRYFVSRPLTIIPVLCMTLGVAALIVILAVMDGFQAQLRATLRGTLSDLIIRVNYDSDFDAWEKVFAEMGEVKAVSPHLQSFCLVAEIPPDGAPGSEAPPAVMDGALVLGIDPAREAEVSSFRTVLLWQEKGPDGKIKPLEELKSSTPDLDRPFAVFAPRWDDRPGVILGRPLAVRLNVFPPRRLPAVEGEEPRYRYDRVYLTTMVRSDEKKGFSPQQGDFCVTGIYESGNQEIDQHIAYVEREVAKEFFQLKRDPEEIRVELVDYEGSWEDVKRDLYKRRLEIYHRTAKKARAWPEWRLPFVVQTWEDRRRNFLNAIENEKGLIAIIAGMAFIVTGFMIFSILSMIVTMKTRDIGILKALGAKTTGILHIFVLNGLLVGVIGSSAGLLLGLAFTSNINWVKEQLNKAFGWEPFPQNIYLFSEIPTRLVPGEVATVTVMALLFALVGAIIPALRAGRLDPVESLRYE